MREAFIYWMRKWEREQVSLNLSYLHWLADLSDCPFVRRRMIWRSRDDSGVAKRRVLSTRLDTMCNSGSYRTSTVQPTARTASAMCHS